jgi:hypothetical protein
MIFLEEQFSVVEYEKEWLALQDGDELPQEKRSLDVAEGMWVALPDGRVGRVDHVMTEGTLNLGDVEMPATPDDPAALVSVWGENEFDEPVAVKVADLQVAEQPEAARAYQDKPKRKPRKGKRGS